MKKTKKKNDLPWVKLEKSLRKDTPSKNGNKNSEISAELFKSYRRKFLKLGETLFWKKQQVGQILKRNSKNKFQHNRCLEGKKARRLQS